MNRCFAFLLLTLALVALSLQAGAASDFHSATIAVDDHSRGERDRAMKEALERVLIKLTGRANIASEPAASALLAEAPSYALEFGYVDLEEQGKQGLRVSFTSGEINDYLRRQRLPIWPQRRPPVLVWILKEDSGGPREFVSPDVGGKLYSDLDRLFRQRGLPVRYPLYDLEDQLNLPVEEAWRFNGDQLAMANKRYNADRWLVIRCYETSGGDWRLAWVLGGGGRRSSLQSLGADTLDTALAQVVNRAVDNIAAEYVYIPTAQVRGLAVEVSGIDSHASYRQLNELMAGFSMVNAHRLTFLSGDRVALELELDGDRELFLDALAQYDQLSPVGEVRGDGPVALVWRPDARFQ